MSYKKLVPIIYLKDTKAYSDEALTNLISDDAVSVADSFSANGADEIIIMDLSYDDASHDEAIGIIRQITKALDTPVIAGGNVKRVEDVKKYLYAGAKAALLDESRESNMIMMKEVCDRFGKDKIALIYRAYDKDVIQLAKDNEIAFVFVKDGVSYKEAVADFDGIPAIVETSVLFDEIIAFDLVAGISGSIISTTDYDFMKKKHELTKNGIVMNTFTSSIPFSDFKLNKEGLIPVIVQDYKTDEVLMLAYMNEESFNLTIETGRNDLF